MLNYLQKFNNLPKELRDKVSAPAVVSVINELEKEYGVSLATVVMRIMVKDISLVDLAKYFVFEYDLDARKAEQLVEELKEKVFFEIIDYLGFARGSLPVKTDKEKRDDSGEKILGRWMQSKKAETAVRGSNFFFSSEDEEEVKDLAKKVENYVQGGEQTDKSDEKVNRITKELNINFSSDELNNRFKQVLKTYLRGIRNKIDTKQTFVKPVETGGLGMDAGLIEKVLMIADKVNQEPLNQPSVKPLIQIKSSAEGLSEPLKHKDAGIKSDFNKDLTREQDSPDAPITDLKDSGVRDIDYDFSKFSSSVKKDKDIKKSSQDENKPIRLTLDYKKAGPELRQTGQEKQESDIEKKDLSVTSETPMKEKAISGQKSSVISSAPSAVVMLGADDADINTVSVKRPQKIGDSLEQSGKKKMEDVKDVKRAPKLMGPIDELKEMDLVNFHRLSQDSAAALAKIKEKISFLEEESYSKRLAGIKAWRQSPVNKLYLTIGQESIGQKKPINIVIEERKTAGKEFLTNQEFVAIMDLNRDLRF